MSQEQPFLQQVRNTANVTLDLLLGAITNNVNSSYLQANSAYNQANLAYAEANIAYVDATEAYLQANNAYAAANLGIEYAIDYAWPQANAARLQANLAYAQANVGVENSGVTPDIYGSGILIPVINVDIRGRVISASNRSPAIFSPTSAGVVPASGGGVTNFLRADGTFASVAFVTEFVPGANGYRIYSDGYIEQWGRFTMSGGSTVVDFPTEFQTECFFVSLIAAGVTGAQYLNGYPSTIGFTAINDGNPIVMMWWAVGV